MSNSWRIEATASLEGSDIGLPRLSQGITQELTDELADAIARITKRHGAKHTETVSVTGRFINRP